MIFFEEIQLPGWLGKVFFQLWTILWPFSVKWVNYLKNAYSLNTVSVKNIKTIYAKYSWKLFTLRHGFFLLFL